MEPRTGNGKQRKSQPTGEGALDDAMRMSGLLERQLRGRISELENNLRQATDSRERYREKCNALQCDMRGCWMCRLRIFVKKLRFAVLRVEYNKAGWLEEEHDGDTQNPKSTQT